MKRKEREKRGARREKAKSRENRCFLGNSSRSIHAIFSAGNDFLSPKFKVGDVREALRGVVYSDSV